MEKIGRFEILEIIGTGGMGVVHKAFDPNLKRFVAIKMLPEELDSAAAARERFLSTAQIAAALRHPNIIIIHDLGEYLGRPYIVMEFLEGRDLAQEIANPQIKRLEERLNLMLQICAGIADAHQHRVIHRDIKPSNIYLENSGATKILDFGIARAVSDVTQKLTRAIGSPNYMAPEQFDGTYPMDQRSDVFSTGAVFYELLTYRMAFPGPAAAAMQRIVHGEVEPMESINPHLPAEVRKIVMKALARRPEDRFQSVEELAHAVEMAGRSVSACVPALKKEAHQEIRRLMIFVRDKAELLQGDGIDAIEALQAIHTQFVAPMEDTAEAEAALPEDYLSLLEGSSFAKVEHSRLVDLAEKRARLVPQIQEALTLEREGQAEQAIQLMRQVMAEDPTDTRAAQVYAEMSGRARAGELYGRALALRANDLAASVRLLEKVLELDPRHRDAAFLMREAEQSLAEEQEFQDHLCAARDSLKRRSFEAAHRQIQQALARRPENPQALELGTEIAREQQIHRIQREREDRARDLMEQAKRLISEGNLTRARDLVSQALELDPAAHGAHDLLNDLDHRERRAKAVLAAARVSLARDDFEAAREDLTLARSAFPQLEEIRVLEGAVERAEKEKLDRERVSGLLVRSEEALRSQDFEKAAILVREALMVSPHSEEANALNSRIAKESEVEARRSRISALLEESESALAHAELERAAILARQAVDLDASNEEAARLLGRIHKNREEAEIVRLFAEALRARRSADLDGALRSVQAILLLRPNTKSAQQLLGRIEADIRRRDQGVVRRLFRRSIPWIALALVVAGAGLWRFPQIMSLVFPKPPGTAVEEHLQAGRYAEAERAAELWAQREPENQRALEYYRRVMEIRASLEAFESALQEKNFQKAKDANLRVENLNPADPAGSVRRQKLMSVFSPDVIDEFLGGLEFWNAPAQWGAEGGKLRVRSGIGTLKDKHYEDFEASFNLSFVNLKGAVWILRSDRAARNGYLFQLNGPLGNPPNSFSAFVRVDGESKGILGPIPVGANLGSANDQFNLRLRASGATIEHWMEIVSAPAEEPHLLGRVVDTTFTGGTVGFGVKDGEEFLVRAFKILSVRRSP